MLGWPEKWSATRFGGGSSSGNPGVGVREHGRRSWGVLRTPEITVSTSVGSDTGWGGCGHGHAMAGGEKLSAAVGDGARGRERRGRAQERQRRLTADPFEAETRPGMVRSRRIERRRVPVAEEGNGDVGGDAGLPETRGSVGRKRGSRRSS